MGDIGTKIDKFIEIFINNRGYVKVLEGLKNTLIIAVIGLVIGVVIGTLIAMVRVIPKYKRLPRVLDAICRFYVGLFRGTPMVVQLLVFYYVLLPLMDAHMTGVQVSIMVFGLNSGAYISEIMRSGILSVDPGQMEGGRAMGFVGASDLYVAFNFIGSNSYEFMIPYLVMAIIYIVLVLLISFGIKMMERSLRKSDRSH